VGWAKAEDEQPHATARGAGKGEVAVATRLAAILQRGARECAITSAAGEMLSPRRSARLTSTTKLVITVVSAVRDTRLPTVLLGVASERRPTGHTRSNATPHASPSFTLSRAERQRATSRMSLRSPTNPHFSSKAGAEIVHSFVSLGFPA